MRREETAVWVNVTLSLALAAAGCGPTEDDDVIVIDTPDMTGETCNESTPWPLSLGYTHRRNSIGEHVFELIAENDGEKTVDAWRADVYALDDFGDPVESIGDEAIQSSADISPGGETTTEWTAHFYDEATKFLFLFTELQYADGSRRGCDSDCDDSCGWKVELD
jgi:hypothetical protein